MAHRLIRLEISDAPASGGRIFTYNLRLDDTVLVSGSALTLAQSDLMRDMVEAYSALFIPSDTSQSIAPLAAAALVEAQLKAMGNALFAAWLEPHWSRLTANPGETRILIIASSVPDILNLPWELLRPPDPDQAEIGTHPGWGIRRLPWPDRKLVAASDLAAGPLRVLFVACSPRGMPELDYELEEELLSRAVGPKTNLDIATLGTFDELIDRLVNFKPHIVHLSGHGTLVSTSSAFVFEDIAGKPAPQPAKELAMAFAGSGVKCVFISGCESGNAPPRNSQAGLCQAIVAEGVPMAVGWAAAIVDDNATIIAKQFYRWAAGGNQIDYALAHARWFAKKAVAGSGDVSWSLPVLYSTTIDTRLFNSDLAPVKKSNIPPGNEFKPLPPIQRGSEKIPYLIGRRRELQTILPGLLQSNGLRGVILTGMGYSGKSSLAARLARKLEAQVGLRPVVVARDTPLDAKYLLKVCATAFLLAGCDEAHKRATAENLLIEAQLSALVSDLSDGFVLVIDNFQISMDETTREIQDDNICEFYRQLMANLVGTSRVIITSRYLPAASDPPPDDIPEISVSEFSSNAYLKFMFRDAAIKQRYQLISAKRKTLSELRSRLGAAPGFAKQVRLELKNIDPDKLQADLGSNTPTVSSTGSLGLLERKYDQFCADLSIDRHHGRLSEEFKRILTFLAVYAEPISATDLAEISGCQAAVAEQALTAFGHAALIYRDVDPKRSIYGTLRRWLLADSRCSTAALESAHRTAADYVIKLDTARSGGKPRKSDFDMLMRARLHYLASGSADKAREITSRLSDILSRRGDYAEIENLNRELLKGGDQPVSGAPVPGEHPEPISWIARAYFDRTDYPEAEKWFRRALEQAGDNYPVEHAEALQGLATIAFRNGQDETAKELFGKALIIQESNNDSLGQALTWHQLGSMALNCEDHARARSNFDQTLRLLSESRANQGNTIDAAKLDRIEGTEQAVMHQLGSIALEEDNLEDARKYLDKALTIALQIEDRKAEADAKHQLGRLEAKPKNKNYAKALEFLKVALETRWEIGDRNGEISSFGRLGEVAAQLARPDLELKLAIVSYIIGKVVKSDPAKELDRVKRLALAQGLDSGQLDTAIKEVEQKYLSDRGRGLLRQVYALGPRSP